MYDLIVVGGGPAGLTATMYAIRKRLNVLLISRDLGGKTNYHLELPETDIQQPIRGLEVVERFRHELEYLNFAWQKDEVQRVAHEENHFLVHTAAGNAPSTRALVVATGARHKWLDVPGERDYLSRGLCYSALSYAPLFIDKQTAVIGHEDLALRSAAELATVAAHVTLIGPGEMLLHTPLGQKLSAAPNVTVLPDYAVTRILGNGYCQGIVAHGPQGDKVTIEVDGAFIEEALLPNSGPVADLVALDAEGFVVVDAYCRTSIPGIFAAGDVTNIFAEQVLVAVGEGVKATLSAYEYLLPALTL